MLGQELSSRGKASVGSPKCKHTGRLEKCQKINVATGDLAKGNIKRHKNRGNLGLGKRETIRKDLEGL